MRWLLISLIIGTLLGLCVRYDLSRDSLNYTYKLDVSSVRKDNKIAYQIQNPDLQMCSSKLFDIHLSYSKGWHIYCTKLDMNYLSDEYKLYIKFVNNQTVIRKINAYLYGVYKLSGIESVHELITHRSLIYRGIYDYYHRYRIQGADVKRTAIIVNDIYNMLNSNGNDIAVNDDHFEFTAIERWAMNTSMATLYPNCFECSYNVVLYHNDEQKIMTYSKFIDRRLEKFRMTDELVDKKYHMVFKNNKYTVFMLFGNGKWYLNNNNCEMNLIKMYADQLNRLIG